MHYFYFIIYLLNICRYSAYKFILKMNPIRWYAFYIYLNSFRNNILNCDLLINFRKITYGFYTQIRFLKFIQRYSIVIATSGHQVFYQYSSPQYLASTLSIFALPTGFAVWISTG